MSTSIVYGDARIGDFRLENGPNEYGQPTAISSVFVSQIVPSSMVTGQTYTVHIKFTNNGTTAWTAATNFKLSSANPADNTTWGFNRVALSGGDNIGNGQTKEFIFNVVAPAVGTYDFQWQMTVDPGSGVFGDLTTNISINVVSNTGTDNPPAPGSRRRQSVN